jgi:5-methylthioadenosine/S-adenosylhomocysteine deaminase
MRPLPADFCIEARWVLPMSGAGEVLEHHALMVRDGRIIEILPRLEAARRYAPTTLVQRPTHALLPGFINVAARAATTSAQIDLALDLPLEGEQLAQDGALAAIAEMLRAGTTCYVERDAFPEAAARAAADQGMRAVVGVPIGETQGAAAAGPGDVSRALAMFDTYHDHPLVSIAFAPAGANALSDATFRRVAMLVDELDARTVIDLHASRAELAESLRLHGVEPLERLDSLGLLTPSLNAVHLCHAQAADIQRAERTGIAVSLCPLASIEAEERLPPVASLAAARIRAGIGSAGAAHQPRDLWTNLKLVAAMLRTGAPETDARRALFMATAGAAAVLGMEAETGSLEPGKWADLCCVDLGGPSAQLHADPVARLVFRGSRDMVSDVWVAGRQLLSESVLTRLDWPSVAARLAEHRRHPGSRE